MAKTVEGKGRHLSMVSERSKIFDDPEMAMVEVSQRKVSIRNHYYVIPVYFFASVRIFIFENKKKRLFYLCPFHLCVTNLLGLGLKLIISSRFSFRIVLFTEKMVELSKKWGEKHGLVAAKESCALDFDLG